MTDRVWCPPMRPPFLLGTVKIEALLDDAESNARRNLIDEDISEDDINTCLTGPDEKYLELVNAHHRVFFDDRCRFEICILQHAHAIRNFLSDPTQWFGERELTSEEWVSHGYMLGYLQLLSTAQETAASFKSAYQSAIAQGPRSKNPIADKVIDDFRDKYESPMNKDIKCFGRYIGESRIFDDLNIEVIKAKNTSKRSIYKFKFLGSKHISETITRDGIRKKLKDLAKKDKK